MACVNVKQGAGLTLPKTPPQPKPRCSAHIQAAHRLTLPPNTGRKRAPLPDTTDLEFFISLSSSASTWASSAFISSRNTPLSLGFCGATSKAVWAWRFDRDNDVLVLYTGRRWQGGNQNTEKRYSQSDEEAKRRRRRRRRERERELRAHAHMHHMHHMHHIHTAAGSPLPLSGQTTCSPRDPVCNTRHDVSTRHRHRHRHTVFRAHTKQ